MIEHHIILMESDESRLNHFNNHFTDFIAKNEISIFSAITKDSKEFISLPKNINLKIHKKFSNIATVGQIGCALSHISLYWKQEEIYHYSLINLENVSFINGD